MVENQLVALNIDTITSQRNQNKGNTDFKASNIIIQ